MREPVMQTIPVCIQRPEHAALGLAQKKNMSRDPVSA